MTRLLYEVAVLTDGTRNRDVQWEIQPICTSSNCSIHPFLHNEIMGADHQEQNIFTDDCLSENPTRFKSVSSVESTKCTSRAFEVGQSISGYSTEYPSTSEFSEGIELDELSWLRNPYIINDVTSNTNSQESVEWKETVDFFSFNKDIIEATVVPSPCSIRSDIPHQSEGKNGRDDEQDSVSDDWRVNEESEEITKPRSFRDVLLGLGHSANISEEKSSGSDAMSEVDQCNKTKQQKSISNSSMSLSVPESEVPRGDLQSEFLSSLLRMDQNNDLESSINELNDQNDEAQSAPAKISHYNQPANEKSPKIVESSVTFSPQTKALSDTETNGKPNSTSVTKGKSKKPKRRKKLAAKFSSPNKQASKPLWTHVSPYIKINGVVNKEVQNEFLANESSDDATEKSNCTPTPKRTRDDDADDSRNQTAQGSPMGCKIQQNHITSIPSDSGVGMNGTDLCDTQGSIEIGQLAETGSHTGYGQEPSEVATESTSGFSSVLESDTQQSQLGCDNTSNINKKIVLQNSPYKCRIPHENDFLPLEKCISLMCHLPKPLQTRANFESLLSISQRVVRIAVRKAYVPIDPNMADEYHQMQGNPFRNLFRENTSYKSLSEHFGTGFVFYIDEEQIQIRTHSHLVRTAEDAKSALIQFNIHDPECDGELTIECRSHGNGFVTNRYSHASILTCTTPQELRPFVKLFRECPIKHNSSVFNDSCYYTDSSAESSFVGWEENCVKEDAVISTTINTLFDNVREIERLWENETTEELKSETSFTMELIKNESAGSSPSRNISSNDILSNDPLSPKTGFPKSLGYDYEMNNSAFPMESSETVCPPDDWLKRDTESLQSKELVCPTSKGNSPSKDMIHVEGFKNAFTPFNNYAADLIEASLPKLKTSLNVSPFIEQTEKWDYNSLLYAQNYYKDEYNSFFKPTEFDGEIKAQHMSQLKGHRYDVNFDRVLLLGQDLGCRPLQKDITLERIAAETLSEDVKKHKNPDSLFSTIAIMISHPHGGSKKISCGQFSSKHYGGEFYDMSTCVGTCGAPIISFSDNGHLYLTDIIHSGTTNVDLKVEKFGLSHFHDSFNSLTQMSIIL